ncbi:MAG: MMPL family transporter [Actinomycetota bacterium]
MLERVARWSYRRRWTMLGIWVAALIGSGFLASSIGGAYSNDFSLPGAESQEAYDLLLDRFPAFAGDTADIVFQAEDGVTDPQVQSALEGLFADVSELDHVLAVESPYSEEGARQIAPDGLIGYATVRFENLDQEPVPVEVVDELKASAQDAEVPGLAIEPGGSAVVFSEFEEPGGAESIGFLAAIIILLVTFGSVLAMLLPIMMALFGIGIGLSLMFLFANFLNVPDFAPQLASMIGIGVGIDYALFIVTRYRHHLHAQHDPEAANLAALVTAGRAVLFAGTVVVISLLGMLLMGFAFVEGLAVGSAVTVLVTMLASVTLLPAVIGFAGHNIDRWRLPWFHRGEDDPRASIWFRWSRVLQRRPLIPAIAGLLVLLVLAIPVLDMRLGFADAGSGDTSRSSRRAYDLLSEGFGPGFNGPLLLVADLSDPNGVEQLEALPQAIGETDGVVAASPPIMNESGDAAVITVFPSTSPQNEDTTSLVHDLREEVIPETMQGSDTPILVGGLTASVIDFSDVNGERLPILIAVVIAVSFLLLVVVFRSILVPLKAAIMNLLSIGAAYGVIVAIFQWGWGKDLIGVESTAPIEAWAPMMLFTILFGLSMDYEIFLLSRIREEYVKTGDNALAVANGLATTARVITAAAAIMITVFLSFVFGFDERAIKLFGMGLAVAIFVDATIVRMVLVPATMELLGDANWWFPKWLDRIVPRISIEPHTDVPVDLPKDLELSEEDAKVERV